MRYIATAVATTIHEDLRQGREARPEVTTVKRHRGCIQIRIANGDVFLFERKW